MHGVTLDADIFTQMWTSQILTASEDFINSKLQIQITVGLLKAQKYHMVSLASSNGQAQTEV
jgi:hypothetical protein